MLIKKEELSEDAYHNIIRDNVMRGADLFEGNMDYTIDKVDRLIVKGELIMVYSQAKNDVTLVHKDNFK